MLRNKRKKLFLLLLDKLWSEADTVFKSSESIEKVLSEISKFDAVDAAYKEVLNRGGIHVFSRSLRIFGLTNSKDAKNISWWNESKTWKSEYRDFFTDVWAFAEDVFGNQFLFDNSGVVWLELETGKLKWLTHTFTEWISLINKKTNYYTGASVSEAWQKAHPDEPLTGMYHLCPVTLFVCGGEYEIGNLFRFDAKDHMSIKAKIARQIKDLPNGSKIEIAFED